jgi:pimeloyl-ACP methyl ester carboxylesterase
MAESVDINGLRIAYERAGSGPPLVLIHGFVGDGRSTWSSQLDELSDEFTVVAWDAPGAGRSPPPPPSFRIADFAACLAEFVRALGLDQPHMVGLSFGGIVLLELFRTRSTVPRTAVLAGAYAGWAGSLPPDIVSDRLQRCITVADLPSDQFASAMLSSMFSDSAPQNAVAGFAASVEAFDRTGFLAMARSSAEADLTDVLPSVDVPTLLLYGDRDSRAPMHVAHAIQAAVPDAALVVMPGVGHVSPVEAPDQFNRAVRDFLRAAHPAQHRNRSSTGGRAP